jgi:hypothetical protein
VSKRGESVDENVIFHGFFLAVKRRTRFGLTLPDARRSRGQKIISLPQYALHNEMGAGGAMHHPTYGVCVSAAYRPFCTSLCLFMPFFVTHPRFLFSLESFFSPNDLFSVWFHFSLYTHVVLIIYSDCNTYYALLFQIFIP